MNHKIPGRRRHHAAHDARTESTSARTPRDSEEYEIMLLTGERSEPSPRDDDDPATSGRAYAFN